MRKRCETDPVSLHFASKRKKILCETGAPYLQGSRAGAARVRAKSKCLQGSGAAAARARAKSKCLQGSGAGAARFRAKSKGLQGSGAARVRAKSKCLKGSGAVDVYKEAAAQGFNFLFCTRYIFTVFVFEFVTSVSDLTLLKNASKFLEIK
jgi:hypothetical protein